MRMRMHLSLPAGSDRSEAVSTGQKLSSWVVPMPRSGSSTGIP